MIRAIFLACACLLATQAGLWGDSAAGKSVAELVKDLSSNDFQVRDAAIKAIEKLGPDALEELKKHKDHPDLEVRRHVEKWIPQFEKDLFVRPKRVSLKLVDRPLQEAVAELAKQTGYKIELAKNEEKDKSRFSFQFDNITYWEALQRICKEGEVEAQPGENGSVTLNYQDTHAPFVHLHDAFRMRAANLSFNGYTSTSKHIQLAAIPRKGEAPKAEEQKSESKNFQFGFTIGAEPRLALSGVGTPILSEAVDDKGQSLLPKREDEPGGFRRGRIWSRVGFGGGRFSEGMEQHAHVQLMPAAEGARTIKIIRGSVPVFLEKDKKTTVLLDSLKDIQGKKLKAGKTTVEIDLFKEGARGRYSLYVTMTRDKPANNNNEDELDELEGSLELQDDKGNSYGIYGSGTSSDGTVTEAHYSFGAPFNGGNIGPPSKLVYVTRTSVEHLVPFEFKDIPLP